MGYLIGLILAGVGIFWVVKEKYKEEFGVDWKSAFGIALFMVAIYIIMQILGSI